MVDPENAEEFYSEQEAVIQTIVSISMPALE